MSTLFDYSEPANLCVKNRIHNQLFQRYFYHHGFSISIFQTWIVKQYAELSTLEHSEHSGVLSSAQECSGLLRVFRSPQFGKLLHFPDLEN